MPLVASGVQRISDFRLVGPFIPWIITVSYCMFCGRYGDKVHIMNLLKAMKLSGQLLHIPAMLIISVVVLVVVIASCDRSPNNKKEILEVLKISLNVEMIDTVRQGEAALSWADFRSTYHNISVVYLQDGCAPCYPKFVAWHKRMEQIATANDHTVLFVINGRDYTSFTRNTDLHGEIKEKYYYYIDPRNEFFRYNSDISRPVLDRSQPIDSNNRIKMVGEPFANADMTKVFHIVTGVDTQHSDESK